MLDNMPQLLLLVLSVISIVCQGESFEPCLNVIKGSSSGVIFHPDDENNPQNNRPSSPWLQDLPWPFVCVWAFDLEVGETIELVFEEIEVLGYIAIEQRQRYMLGSSYPFWVQKELLQSTTRRGSVTFNHSPIRIHTLKNFGSFFMTYQVSFCSWPRLGRNIRMKSCSNGMKKGSVCLFTCDRGYAFTSPDIKSFKSTCRSDKTWSPMTISECESEEKLISACLDDDENSPTKKSGRSCSYSKRQLARLFHAKEDDNVEIVDDTENTMMMFAETESDKQTDRYKCREFCKRSWRTRKFVQLCKGSGDQNLCLYCRYGKKVCPFLLNIKR